MAFVIRVNAKFGRRLCTLFDTTPHDDNVDAHKCYCVCWCSYDFAGKDFSTAKREENVPGNT